MQMQSGPVTDVPDWNASIARSDRARSLRAGVTRSDAIGLYQGLVMSLVMHDARATTFGKPRTGPTWHRAGPASCWPGSAPLHG